MGLTLLPTHAKIGKVSARLQPPETWHVKGADMQRNHIKHPLVRATDYIVDEATGCWLWWLRIDQIGYARIFRKAAGARTTYAHRVYFEFYRGLVPEGLELDHLCRTRHCVNPDHLEPVTHAVNCQRSSTVKLSYEQAQEIREIRRTQGLYYRTIAEMFGVTLQNIH